MLEGQSEVEFISRLFPLLFGFEYGTGSIELVNLRGIGNATGNSREDRYNAIFRLVDYLQDHQVVVFVVLDNEGGASRLKDSSKTKKSLSGLRRRVIAPERVKVWKKTFEFDNFSDSDLARALTLACNEQYAFSRAEMRDVRDNWREKDIAKLFAARTGGNLNKVQLARILAELAVSPTARKQPLNRPFVKLLGRAVDAGLMNALPVTERGRRLNQRALDRPYLRTTGG